MKLRVAFRVLLVAVVAATPAVVLPDDEWEVQQGGEPDDDTSATHNQLVHGSLQRHDLQGVTAPTDQDWSVVSVKARHSYEALAFNSTFCWMISNCAAMNRVDSGGTILTQGFLNDGNFSSVYVRWIAPADANEFVRVDGLVGGFSMDANAKYDILFRETTMNIARWNQSGSQTTVIVLRNTTAFTFGGSLDFYDNPNGVLLASAPFAMAAHGGVAISLAGITGLAGLAGTAAVAHTGTYGAISGKAVALEPATGFTFDTPVEAVPY